MSNRPTWSDLTAEEQALLFDEGVYDLKCGPTHMLQWAEDLAELCRIVKARPAHRFVVALFWIRLHETVTSALARYAASTSTGSLVPGNKAHDKLAAVAAANHATCKAIRDALSEDELVYVELERHRAAHVRVDHYSFAIVGTKGKKNTKPSSFLKKEARVSSLNRMVPLAEVKDALARVKARHGEEPESVARALGARLEASATAHAEQLAAKVDLFRE